MKVAKAQSDDIYFVEELRAKRTLGNGMVEYLVKWKGWSEKQKTWEPEEHFNPSLIKKFEQSRMKRRNKRKQNSSSSVSYKKVKRSSVKNQTAVPGSKITSEEEHLSNVPIKEETKEAIIKQEAPTEAGHAKDLVKRDPDAVGFERGLVPEAILGAVSVVGEIFFLIKWKDSKMTDLVPAREANAKCPQTVIRFYEQRIEWKPKV